jgi:hypothetical protein
MGLLKCTTPNVEDWIALLSILEIPGSNLGQEIGHSDRFFVTAFTSFRQVMWQ